MNSIEQQLIKDVKNLIFAFSNSDHTAIADTIRSLTACALTNNFFSDDEYAKLLKILNIEEPYDK